MALTPAFELAIGEQGAGVRVSARDRGRSHAPAQRDGGKVIAHMALVAAMIVVVAEAQLAIVVPPCSHGLQDKRSGIRSPAKLVFQVQTFASPYPPSSQSSEGAVTLWCTAQAMSAQKEIKRVDSLRTKV